MGEGLELSWGAMSRVGALATLPPPPTVLPSFTSQNQAERGVVTRA